MKIWQKVQLKTDIDLKLEGTEKSSSCHYPYMPKYQI